MTLLNNKMFDDGSFECFNFWLADQDGTYQVGANEQLVQEYKSHIEKAMQAGKSHINISSHGIIWDDMRILEIQWG